TLGRGLREGHAERRLDGRLVRLEHGEGECGVLVGRRADDAHRAAVLPATDDLGVTSTGHGAGDPVFGDPPHLVPVGGREGGGGSGGGGGGTLAAVDRAGYRNAYCVTVHR